MALMDKLFDLASKGIEKGAKALGDQVHVDERNKRVFVSDFIVHKAVQLAASRLEDGKLLEFDRVPEGYRCSVQAGQSVICASARVTQFLLHGGTVTVFLETPNPIEVVDRPIVTFLAMAVSQVFGGTAVGEWILSGPLPDGATWDGCRASFTFDLADAVQAPAWAQKVPVVVDVVQDANGLWLRFADETRQVMALFHLIAAALPLFTAVK